MLALLDASSLRKMHGSLARRQPSLMRADLHGLEWFWLISEYRKQGIGTQLLKRTIEYLDQRKIPTMKLDATPQGQPLYRKLGFVTEYEIERWILKRPTNTIASVGPSSRVLLNDAQLESILKLDQDVFGADRSFLLNSLRDSSPNLAIGAWSNGLPQGYTFGRSGLFADQLGPWMATSRQRQKIFSRNS